MTKAKTRGQISVRGETYDKLRAYCRKHGVQIRTVVDDLLKQALADAEAKGGN